MEFTTLDMEFADVILPSICSISIIDWDDNGIKNIYSTLINPDCDIEDFLYQRHKITSDMVKDAPTIQEAWIDIYNRLENKVVFSHYANRNFKALSDLAAIKYLKMPHCIFACSASISRKLWPYFSSDKLPVISERLGVNYNHFNSLEDAKSVGFIVQRALEDTHSCSFEDLYSKVGFSGGYIENGEKKIYRAIKSPLGYIAKKQEDGELINDPLEIT